MMNESEQKITVDPKDDFLTEALAGVSPLDLDCQVLPDPQSGKLIWFKHPKYEGVFAKFGSSEKDDRVMRVWLRLDETNKKVVILDVDLATDKEIEFLEKS